MSETGPRSSKADRGTGEAFLRRPSDRAYARLHGVFLGVIAAVVVYGFAVARFVQTPRGVGFRLAMVVLLSLNVLWWAIADRRLARFVRSSRTSGAWRATVLLFTLAINAPVAFILATTSMPEWFTRGPTWYAAAVTLWHLGLAALLPGIILLRLVSRGARYAWRRHLAGEAPDAAPELQGGPRATPPPRENIDPGRRAFLQTALAGGPMLVLGLGTAESLRQEGRLAIHTHELSAPWLPERLRGLTITHLSDLHVGRLYRPHLLPRLVELANRLDGDVVVLTGDVVDNSNDFLPPALEALEQLRHRYGIFLGIGNHDEIDSRQDFITAVRGKLPLLINERRTLEIGGERLTLAGLDYAGSDEPTGRRAGHIANVARTFAGYQAERDGPAIVLSHHPHAFDPLAERGIPLTLAGHTHGGQLMWTPPGRRPDLGVGSLLFRYLRGFYRLGDSTLFVNSGVGNWFPLRLNAPAEIVRIRLV